MRLRLCLLLCLGLMLGSLNNSYAGFLIKKHTYTADSVASTNTNATTLSRKELKKEQRLHDLNTLKHLVMTKTEGSKGKSHGSSSGWEGIVSFVCGILSLISVATSWLCIPAIIFGILGLHKRHHGLALAGLIIGAIAFIVYILVILFLIAVLGLL